MKGLIDLTPERFLDIVSFIKLKNNNAFASSDSLFILSSDALSFKIDNKSFAVFSLRTPVTPHLVLSSGISLSSIHLELTKL